MSEDASLGTRPDGVSIVVTSRNDDHGGDLLRRTRFCLEALLDQARRHGLEGELILVEWNPPPDRPPLLEALALRVDSRGFPLRVIEVPPEVHERLPMARAVPLFQMIAKNAGIRRARHRFVLATNPDLLLSEALVAFLAKGRLDPAYMYRIDRLDVSRELPLDALDLPQALEWCRRNVIRVHGRWGSREVRRGRPGLYQLPMLIEQGLRALPEAAAKLVQLLLVMRPLPVHTNACGDFTLMAREHWFAARGYAELPLYSMHIDSLLVFSAIGLGVKTRILGRPMRLYHIDHGKSWSATSLEERFTDFVRHPWIDMGLVHAARQRAFFDRRPIIFNDGDWGLAGERLPERTIGPQPAGAVPARVVAG